MDFGKLFAHLETTDEGKAFKSELTTHIEDSDKIKTGLDTEKSKTTSIGDRDIGTLVSTFDWLKENGLDTPEKLAEYKLKSDGLEGTMAEQKAESAKILLELEQGSKQIKADADRVRLDSKVRGALFDKIGDKKVFGYVIGDKMSKNMFAEDGDGNILYGVEGQRRKLDDAFEDMRNEDPLAYIAKPDGTGNPPKPNQQQNQHQTTNSTLEDRMSKIFK